MSELVHTIDFVIGDWSHDGHEKTENVSIKSNLSRDEITEAYELGVKHLGVDLTQDICRDYEESTISKEDLQKFINKGFDSEIKASEFKTRDEFDVDFDYFASLYLFTVLQGNSAFEYKFVESSNINIGGYGLFY